MGSSKKEQYHSSMIGLITRRKILNLLLLGEKLFLHTWRINRMSSKFKYIDKFEFLFEDQALERN
jgi:hypothetical protein